MEMPIETAVKDFDSFFSEQQIQALLAPPSLEDISKEKKKDGLAQHPYYKRPGRGHNRDCCDACKEGGGLICCDSCPASFHLQCQYVNNSM